MIFEKEYCHVPTECDHCIHQSCYCAQYEEKSKYTYDPDYFYDDIEDEEEEER